MTNVIERLSKAEQSPAWNRASAYVILKEGKEVGRLKCKWPADGMGPVEVFLWDWTNPEHTPDIQRGTAKGCGYDKLAAAVDGLCFGGMKFTDHPHDWRSTLETNGYTVIHAL